MQLTDEQLEYVKARILRPAVLSTMSIMSDLHKGKLDSDEAVGYFKEVVEAYAPRADELLTGVRIYDDDNRKA